MNGNGIISRLGNWAAVPFSQNMSLGGWFLLTGLVIISAFFWTRVLRHIVEL
jgi:hypothetical protein